MLYKTCSVGRIGKRHVKNTSIINSLLYSIGNLMVAFFSFNYGERIIVAVEKQIVGAFTSATFSLPSLYYYFTISKF